MLWRLATVDGKVAAVPTDGWGQLLIYRKDLFDAAGLEKPDTFDKIEAAAAALNDPGNNFYGITASNDPARYSRSRRGSTSPLPTAVSSSTTPAR